MTGYVETLTDPSYAGQILTFTYPLIGNYGVSDPVSWESDGIHAAGVVTAHAESKWSHEGSQTSLLEWLAEQSVPIITGVDTRALTKHLRMRGTMPGLITTTPHSQIALPPRTFVSVAQPVSYGPSGARHVVLVDCGTKANILRSLLARGLRVTRVPYDFDFTTLDYDGITLSNGPGDPTDYAVTIGHVKKALDGDKPIFGICLGSQMLALAAGATTYKLPFGHRGHNQPVAQTDGSAYITSQNHGYAVKESSLPGDWLVTFRNLNDQSVEGIAHKTKPFFAVQFHPEASPGPTDTAQLFTNFVESL
jgi:carbamoyl-phosphate synthase small subunit